MAKPLYKGDLFQPGNPNPNDRHPITVKYLRLRNEQNCRIPQPMLSSFSKSFTNIYILKAYAIIKISEWSECDIAGSASVDIICKLEMLLAGC